MVGRFIRVPYIGMGVSFGRLVVAKEVARRERICDYQARRHVEFVELVQAGRASLHQEQMDLVVKAV